MNFPGIKKVFVCEASPEPAAPLRLASIEWAGAEPGITHSTWALPRHYPGITHRTHITNGTQAVPTVPRLYLQYPGCPATDITLALDCYYSPPALHTQQPSLFGGQLLWKERERAEPFHSLECTGSLKPAFQTPFESYLL